MRDPPIQAHSASDQRRSSRARRSHSALLPTRQDLPAYTPMPIPLRISSAKRGAGKRKHRTSREPHARGKHVRTKTPIGHDSLSLEPALAFDDEAMLLLATTFSSNSSSSSTADARRAFQHWSPQREPLSPLASSSSFHLAHRKEEKHHLPPHPPPSQKVSHLPP